jgi:hypothetical protein
MFLPTNKSTDKLIQCHTVIRQFQSPHDVASVKGFLDELKMRIVSCLDNNSPISTLTRSSAIVSSNDSFVTLQAISATSRVLLPMPTVLLPRPEMVNTFDYVFNTVWGLIVELHTREPNHPMFGESMKDCIRAPFVLETGRARSSWHLRAINLASSIRDSMGSTMIKGSCWMSPTTNTRIEKRFSKNANPVFMVNFKFVRWLSFLANPTSQNWDTLTGEKRGMPIKSTQHPFCHTCHNGEGSIKLSRKTEGRESCINGVEHGSFGTTASNTEMKDCKGRSRAKCLGHGSPPTYCFYVHRNGRPKACLNLVVTPSSCNCDFKCF